MQLKNPVAAENESIKEISVARTPFSY